mmetsp:Transcript_61637/g.133466  ORF Transcript_61637/g.133466 Transcript_61637/m.133466 type:complete len:228 (-) Transcript_61637:349-1032(-)
MVFSMAAEEHCILIPGFFGVLVQGLLLLISLGVLVYKKWREGKDRQWREFLLDSSKQLFGAGWIHVANLIAAAIFGNTLQGDSCGWYWVNIVVDTTLGVAIEYGLLLGFTRALEAVTGHKGDFKTGEYRDEEGFFVMPKYLKQLSVWLLCVTGMKLIIVLLMFIFSDYFSRAAAFVLSPFKNDPKLKLVVVMILTPCVMNALQFWLTDNFIQKQKEKRGDTATSYGL